eukprot:2826755-Prymnesium_polylepis.1
MRGLTDSRRVPSGWYPWGDRPRNRPIMCVRDGVGCECEPSIKNALKPRPVTLNQCPHYT